MKMTVSEIQNRHSILITIGGLTLPRKISYAIAKNLVKLEKELKIVLAQKEDIANNYALKDEEDKFVLSDDGKNYTFESSDKKKEYISELEELLDTEIEVDIMTFDVSELDKCEDSDRYNILTPVQEASLSWMISCE